MVDFRVLVGSDECEGQGVIGEMESIECKKKRV